MTKPIIPSLGCNSMSHNSVRAHHHFPPPLCCRVLYGVRSKQSLKRRSDALEQPLSISRSSRCADQFNELLRRSRSPPRCPALSYTTSVPLAVWWSPRRRHAAGGRPRGSSWLSPLFIPLTFFFFASNSTNSSPSLMPSSPWKLNDYDELSVRRALSPADTTFHLMPLGRPAARRQSLPSK